MIMYISASAILTVVATGLQFVGLFLPTWWRSIVEHNNVQTYYYSGIWKHPWKAEICQDDKCHEVPHSSYMTPTWLVFTRLFEVAGAGFGILLIAIMLIWLVLLGPMRTKHRVIARKLGLVSSFMQIITAIFINIGILILVIKTSPSSILTGTFLCGLSFILFCVGGALSYHCVKRMPASGQDERMGNHDASVSVISPPPYCDPPPSYEEIMGAHYMADNPAMVVDANMSPEFNKHIEASGEFPSSSQ